MDGPGSRRLAAAVIAFVAAAALGYWGYRAYLQQKARTAAISLAQNSAQHLRDALAVDTSSASAASAADTLAKLEAHAAAAERNYADFRRIDLERLGALADAGDDYLITAREILRRVAIIANARRSFGDSADALHHHMRSDRGAAAWPRQAVQLKERLDRDYRNYRLAAEALAALLESLPASQARVAPHIDSSRLLEPGVITAARSASLESAERLAADYQKLTRLEAHR